MRPRVNAFSLFQIVNNFRLSKIYSSFLLPNIFNSSQPCFSSIVSLFLSSTDIALSKVNNLLLIYHSLLQQSSQNHHYFGLHYFSSLNKHYGIARCLLVEICSHLERIEFIGPIRILNYVHHMSIKITCVATLLFRDIAFQMMIFWDSFSFSYKKIISFSSIRDREHARRDDRKR